MDASSALREPDNPGDWRDFTGELLELMKKLEDGCEQHRGPYSWSGCLDCETMRLAMGEIERLHEIAANARDCLNRDLPQSSLRWLEQR